MKREELKRGLRVKINRQRRNKAARFEALPTTGVVSGLSQNGAYVVRDGRKRSAYYAAEELLPESL